MLICPLVKCKGMVCAAIIYCWEDCVWTNRNVDTCTHQPLLSWQNLPEPMGDGVHKSKHSHCPPRVDREKVAMVLTAGSVLIRKSPGWTSLQFTQEIGAGPVYTGHCHGCWRFSREQNKDSPLKEMTLQYRETERRQNNV